MTVEQLQPFCADETRPGLSKPFTMDGYTWATDGRVLVRTHVIEGVGDTDQCFGAYTPAALMAQCDAGPEWLAMPELQPGDGAVACSRCGGHVGPCKACNGEGEVGAVFTYDGKAHTIYGECPVCDGFGICPDCDGNGTVPEPEQHIKLGPARFRLFDLRRLATMPHCEFAPLSSDAPCRIRFDGGEGMVMPVIGGGK